MKIIDSGMPVEELWSGFFSPKEILNKMGLTAKMKWIVDLGCGYGTFTIPAAIMLPGSIIYAIDIEKEMIETVQKKASEENLRNIVAVQRDFIAIGTKLADKSVDYVMLFNILHAENPVEILSETFRILKKGGKAGIIHWIFDSKTPRGPSLEIRPKPEQCKQWTKKAGFSIIGETISLPPYHYGIQIGA
ncbi:MAG: class I SAM-dependent methyltransferase [Chitinispirillaceae bacterium]|jgi:ubiquinone/menaquinone biosynthesis C-methylase UbiE